MDGHLRRIRKRLGLNQTAFAGQLGIHPVTLSNYERDAEIVPVTITRLAEMYHRFGVPADLEPTA